MMNNLLLNFNNIFYTVLSNVIFIPDKINDIVINLNGEYYNYD